MRSRCSLYLSLVAVFAAALAIAFPRPGTSGDAMIEISPVNVTGGVEASHGVCPCFRWSVDVELASGEIETKHFLISTDALFEISQRYGFMDGELSSRLMTVGAVEALWKGGHIGLGFNGVTFGHDLDRGYTDILRTGLYVLANIVRTDALRFDIRSGYEFEQHRTNFGPIEQRHMMPTSLVFDWRSGGWSGNVMASMGLDLSDPGWDSMDLSASASVEYRVIKASDFRNLGFEAALGLNVYAEHEAHRAEYGLETTGYGAMLYMRLGWMRRFGGRR